MKRIIIFFFSVLLLVILVNSCYTTHKCPAYGYYSEAIEQAPNTPLTTN